MLCARAAIRIPTRAKVLCMRSACGGRKIRLLPILSALKKRCPSARNKELVHFSKASMHPCTCLTDGVVVPLSNVAMRILPSMYPFAEKRCGRVRELERLVKVESKEL